jgi:rod shape determining protein RodA
MTSMLTSGTLLPGSPVTNLRRDPSSPWRHLDWVLIGATLAVSLLGVLMVYSATRTSASDPGVYSTAYLWRQVAFVLIGVALAGVVFMFDYRHYQHLAPVFYVVCIGLLVLVLSPLGTEVNGSQSWFAVGSFQFQPAELAKLAVIGLVALMCSTSRGSLDGRGLLVALLLAGVPAGLILLQPDVGSTMVFGAVVAAIVLVAGASGRQLAALVLIGVIGVIGIFQLDLIEGYQRERLTMFANPSGAESGSQAAYNGDQAQTAIGAGGTLGAGLFNGTQTKLSYVPYQHSDFVFTVVGEELGFAGSVTLLALYAVMAWRIWRTAAMARDLFGTLLCVGIMGLLLFQIFQNIGMTTGIMPITGIPLPFMSYGGSFTLTMFAAMGLVLNVHARRYS